MLTTMRRTKSERRLPGARSVFLGLAGALLSTIAFAGCGKTDSQSSGETHFLAYCEQSCAAGYDCICGACTLACDDDAACEGTSAGSSCLSAPAACGSAPRQCDVACSADAECSDLGAGARCRSGRCRIGTPPPPDPPADPFALCGDARPPSSCSFAETCDALSCGGLQYDERGCARAECATDAECTGDDVCVATAAVNTGSCEPRAEDGVCQCSGPAIARPGAFCNPPDAPPPFGELCDGSAGVRLARVDGGGFVPPGFDFLNPHGASFLAVDGNCRFFVQEGDTGEIRSGTLDPAGAAELATAAGWRLMPVWNFHTDEGCPDGGAQSLLAEQANVSCSCGCDDDAPRGVEEALGNTSALQSRWFAEGAPLDGPVRAVTMLPEIAGVGDTQPVFDWPLEQSVDTFAFDELTPTAGIVLDDPDAANALRELRAQNEAAGVTTGVILVRAEDDSLRALFIRDELPAEIDASLTALRAASNQ